MLWLRWKNCKIYWVVKVTHKRGSPTHGSSTTILHMDVHGCLMMTMMLADNDGHDGRNADYWTTVDPWSEWRLTFNEYSLPDFLKPNYSPPIWTNVYSSSMFLLFSYTYQRSQSRIFSATWVGLCSAPNAASGEDMASVVLAVRGPWLRFFAYEITHVCCIIVRIDMLEISGYVETLARQKQHLDLQLLVYV